MIYPEATVQSQYAASPTIRALVDGFNKGVDPRADEQLFFDRIFNPATAQGIGLDIWARIVGVERNVYIDRIDKNFGFFIQSAPTQTAYEIAPEIQSLPGYGWSAGSAYNYVDFVNRQYVQSVKSVSIRDGSWVSDSSTGLYYTYSFSNDIKKASTNNDVGNLLCTIGSTYSRNALADGSDLGICVSTGGAVSIRFPEGKAPSDYLDEKIYYELATPIETSIATLIPSVSVEPSTSMTFKNVNGDGFHIPVPSEISYLEDDETVTDSTVAYKKTIGGVQGDVTIKKIGGKSFVYNQLNINGDFTTISGLSPMRGTLSASDNVLTLTCNQETSTASYFGTSTIANCHIPITNGHKYYLCCDQSADHTMTKYVVTLQDASVSTGYNIVSYEAAFTAVNDWVQCAGIFTAANDTTARLFCYPRGTSTQGQKLFFRNMMIIDLTMLYGQGNEPSSVEEFKSLYSAPYYSYSLGEIKSAVINEVGYVMKDGLWQDWQPWDQGVFYEPGDKNKGLYRIDDKALRKFIFWKALANISTADCYTLNRLLSKLFNFPVCVEETGVMHIKVTTMAKLEDWQAAILAQYGMFGKPAGVGFEFWSVETPVLGLVPDGDTYLPFGQAPFFNGVIQNDLGGN